MRVVIATAFGFLLGAGSAAVIAAQNGQVLKADEMPGCRANKASCTITMKVYRHTTNGIWGRVDPTSIIVDDEPAKPATEQMLGANKRLPKDSTTFQFDDPTCVSVIDGVAYYYTVNPPPCP